MSEEVYEYMSICCEEIKFEIHKTRYINVFHIVILDMYIHY